MSRVHLESLAFFLAPFALYALSLTLQRRYPLAMIYWSRSTASLLAMIGLGLVIASFLIMGIFAPRNQGAYAPAHVENGRVVPGRMQ